MAQGLLIDTAGTDCCCVEKGGGACCIDPGVVDTCFSQYPDEATCLGFWPLGEFHPGLHCSEVECLPPDEICDVPICATCPKTFTGTWSWLGVCYVASMADIFETQPISGMATMTYNPGSCSWSKPFCVPLPELLDGGGVLFCDPDFGDHHWVLRLGYCVSSQVALGLCPEAPKFSYTAMGCYNNNSTQPPGPGCPPTGVYTIQPDTCPGDPPGELHCTGCVLTLG